LSPHDYTQTHTHTDTDRQTDRRAGAMWMDLCIQYKHKDTQLGTTVSVIAIIIN